MREFKGAFDRLNQTIREVGAKNQVLVIDLAREIPPVKENICPTWPISTTGGLPAGGPEVATA